MKDKFKELDKTMTRLELNGNIERASQFINDYYQLSYYTIVSCLG
jgi:hypothetical protein